MNSHTACERREALECCGLTQLSLCAREIIEVQNARAKAKAPSSRGSPKAAPRSRVSRERNNRSRRRQEAG